MNWTKCLSKLSHFGKVKVMRFPDYFKPLPADDKKALASRLGVTLGYLYRLAGGFSSPSLKLTKQIQSATNGAVPVQDWNVSEPEKVT
jgi:hypothetical protein